MSEDLKECIITCLVAFTVISAITWSIAIPCLISEKRNIDKELKLKQLEVYGEYVEEGE